MRLFEKPITDPYGYDAFRLKRAKVVPAGLATIMLGASLGSFAALLPSLRSEDAHAIAQELDKFAADATGGAIQLNLADSNAAISLVVMIFFVIGLCLLGFARTNRKNYMTAYPRIQNFYSSSQKKQALLYRRRWILIGSAVVILFALISITLFTSESFALRQPPTRQELAIPLGIFFLGATPGVWMIAHGIMVGDRVDIFEYNYQALSLTNTYDIRVNQPASRQEIMIKENNLETIFHIVSKTIVSIGAFSTVMLYVVPSLKTPLAPLPFLLSLIGWYVAYKIGEEIARYHYESQDSEAQTTASD